MNMSVTTTYAKLSVISITLTAIITAVHHIYREGWVLLIPGALVVLLPFQGYDAFFLELKGKPGLDLHGHLGAHANAAHDALDTAGAIGE